MSHRQPFPSAGMPLRRLLGSLFGAAALLPLATPAAHAADA
ncbi:hypothetical protein [Cupriavidus numazuensis]|uniref:Uncharacterized protein n=1 Tax=Cupriavidus numazuensis TaxID=221992 RepID=A0ABM8TGS4_9BURK|nr:hypothetical protein [Cupriavidus numazuensis]CAG2145528.1 hypothetical protein LMG26411_02749 [Cupriavidus numazuensis]